MTALVSRNVGEQGDGCGVREPTGAVGKYAGRHQDFDDKRRELVKNADLF